jgi:hypothetical protein
MQLPDCAATNTSGPAADRKAASQALRESQHQLGYPSASVDRDDSTHQLNSMEIPRLGRLDRLPACPGTEVDDNPNSLPSPIDFFYIQRESWAARIPEETKAKQCLATTGHSISTIRATGILLSCLSGVWMIPNVNPSWQAGEFALLAAATRSTLIRYGSTATLHRNTDASCGRACPWTSMLVVRAVHLATRFGINTVAPVSMDVVILGKLQLRLRQPLSAESIVQSLQPSRKGDLRDVYLAFD